MESNRIFYYDLIRAFAIFSIVSCHVFAVYVTNTSIFGTRFWYCALFLNSLRSPGLPLFVVLSGCLLLNRTESLTTFAKKRVSRVIIPYLFWIFVFIICAYLFMNYQFKFIPFSSLNDLLMTIFLFKSNAYHFWFVPMIICVYAVIFLINKLNEHYRHALKISLLVSVLTIILLNANIIPFDNPANYIIFSAYAVIGYYLATFDFKRGKLSSKSLFIIFGAVFIVSFICEVLINASMSLALNRFECVSQFSLINVISVISLFLSARYLSQAFNIGSYKNNLGKIIYSASICSYGIYLCHVLLKFIVLKIVLIHVKFLPVSVYSTLTLILTFVSSWMLIVILSKIPYINKLSGAG